MQYDLLMFLYTFTKAYDDHSTKPQIEFFERYLGAIREAFGDLEAEEASGRHLEVRSQKSDVLSSKMQKLY